MSSSKATQEDTLKAKVAIMTNGKPIVSHANAAAEALKSSVPEVVVSTSAPAKGKAKTPAKKTDEKEKTKPVKEKKDKKEKKPKKETAKSDAAASSSAASKEAEEKKPTKAEKVVEGCAAFKRAVIDSKSGGFTDNAEARLESLTTQSKKNIWSILGTIRGCTTYISEDNRTLVGLKDFVKSFPEFPGSKNIEDIKEIKKMFTNSDDYDHTLFTRCIIPSNEGDFYLDTGLWASFVNAKLFKLTLEKSLDGDATRGFAEEFRSQSDLLMPFQSTEKALADAAQKKAVFVEEAKQAKAKADAEAEAKKAKAKADAEANGKSDEATSQKRKPITAKAEKLWLASGCCPSCEEPISEHEDGKKCDYDVIGDAKEGSPAKKAKLTVVEAPKAIETEKKPEAVETPSSAAASASSSSAAPSPSSKSENGVASEEDAVVSD